MTTNNGITINREVHQEQEYLAHQAMEQTRKSKVKKTISISGMWGKGKAKMRAANPIMAGRADIVNWTLYDRITAAQNTATASQYTFYNTPIGAGNKTKNDTNLEQVSRLPDPQFFNATQLGFVFNNMILLDAVALANAYYCEFWVGQKVYVEGPINLFPGGAGFQGFSNITAAATQQNISNGMPYGLSVMYDLRLPSGLNMGDFVSDGLTGVTILQGQNFHVRLIGTSFTLTSGATGLNVLARLDGVLSRGVQ